MSDEKKDADNSVPSNKISVQMTVERARVVLWVSD